MSNFRKSRCGVDSRRDTQRRLIQDSSFKLTNNKKVKLFTSVYTHRPREDCKHPRLSILSLHIAHKISRPISLVKFSCAKTAPSIYWNVGNCKVDIEYYRASVTRSCEYPLRGLERGADNDM